MAHHFPQLPLALLALLSIFLSVPALAIPGPRGDWKAQDTLLGLDAFADGTRSFPVAENERFCALRVVPLGPPNGSVVDYGQAISAALRTARIFGGGSVRLAPGVYPIRSPIVFPSGTCLLGAGMSATVLNVRDTFTRIAPGRGILRATAARRITLKGFTLSGTRNSSLAGLFYARDGVHFEIVNYVWIKDVRMRDNPDNGFDFVGERTRWAYHLAVEGCVSSDNGRDGFNIAQTYYASLSSSRAARVGRNGVRVSTGARNVLLQDNGVVDARQCGLLVEPGPAIGNVGALAPSGVRGVRNTVLSAAVAGVCLRNSSRVTLRETQIINLRDAGATCYDLRASTFDGADGSCATRSGVKFAPQGRPAAALPIPQGPGAGCAKGILNRDVCCPAACGVCGGPGCGTRLAGAQCCATEIRAANRRCSSNPPPCVVP